MSYAARKSWAFDVVFFGIGLRGRIFGDYCEENLKSRIKLQTPEKKNALEPFLECKLEDQKERILQH
jgi:hypothetical protein